MISLVNNDNVSEPEVIEKLQESLEIAKVKGIENCAVVMIAKDGSILDTWANSNSAFTMVGALDTLKHEFRNKTIESRP